jgi:hypothetical protein
LEGALSKILVIGAAVVAALGLAGCGSNQPTCSSPDTIKVLNQLIERMVKGHDLEGSGFSYDTAVVDIITTDQTKIKATCKANLNVDYKKDGKTLFGAVKNAFTFTAERTDGGELYVTAYGLKL